MILSQTRMRALVTTDAMSPELRECVHEFGMPIVKACLEAGVSSPSRVRQLVKEIWHGAREVDQTGGALNALDWLFIQNQGSLSVKTLLRTLYDAGYAIVPMDATRAMIDASMAEVSGFNVRCTRPEKHKRRFRVAARTGMEELMKSRGRTS